MRIGLEVLLGIVGYTEDLAMHERLSSGYRRDARDHLHRAGPARRREEPVSTELSTHTQYHGGLTQSSIIGSKMARGVGQVVLNSYLKA